VGKKIDRGKEDKRNTAIGTKKTCAGGLGLARWKGAKGAGIRGRGINPETGTPVEKKRSEKQTLGKKWQ